MVKKRRRTNRDDRHGPAPLSYNFTDSTKRNLLFYENFKNVAQFKPLDAP